MIDYVKSEVPSKCIPLLRSFLGCRIVSAVRYSWWPAEESAQECGINEGDVFSLTAGAAAIGLDSGVVLGIGSEPSVASVIIWLEKNSDGDVLRNEPLDRDSDLYPISAQDHVFSNEFWRGVIGEGISSISIFRRNPKNILFADLPNEVALCFELSSGVRFFAAHGLHDDSDDFVVLDEQSIHPSIRQELNELAVIV